MSVRVGDRDVGKLQVLRVSRELCVYTYQICKNEKIFPKSQRWIMSQKIMNESLDALTCIRKANVARNDIIEEQEYRHMQQVEAKAHLNSLLTLIDLAYNVFGIETRRVEYWTKLVDDTLNLLKAWMKSDKQIIVNLKQK